MRIYFPATINVLTKGHIVCIKKLISKGQVIIGLLSDKALKGYKEERMPFKDRKYILESLKFPIKVVKQDTLNPEQNLKKYKCNAIASGDGWEKEELEAINKLGVKIINLNSGEKLHSSDI